MFIIRLPLQFLKCLLLIAILLIAVIAELIFVWVVRHSNGYRQYYNRSVN